MQIYNKGKLETINFELSDNEYIIKINGRSGLVLDSLGFETNLGRSCQIGGKGGSQFSFQAPEGFHFCTFAASCGDCNASISVLLSDILQIPQENTNKPIQNSEILSQKLLPIIRNLVDYLKIEEFLNLFLLNKSFANFRFDYFILKNILTRIIYGLDANQRKYAKIVLGKINSENQGMQELINIYKYTKNKIANSSGLSGFEGWNVSLNGGNGWAIHGATSSRSGKKCFASSFGWDELEYKKKFNEIFDQEQYSDFISGKAILAVGGMVGQSGFGGTAKMSLQLFNSKDELIFEKQIQKTDIPRNFVLMEMQYLHENKKQEDIAYLIFKIAGKDTIYWQGHYGANFTQIFIRMMPTKEKLNQQKQTEKN